jgi:hypothetical protein
VRLAFKLNFFVYIMKTIIFFTMLWALSSTLNLKSSNLNLLSKRVSCQNEKVWSNDIATGRAAPWSYHGGERVKHNGSLYEAMWGGSEVPGSKACFSQESCKHDGIQWMTVGKCKRNNEDNDYHHHGNHYYNHNHNNNHNYNHHHVNKCANVAEWSHAIAFGQVAPWTYNGGNEVQYEGVKYRANWGGQETPGSKQCGNEADCRNKGIQWVRIEKC